MFNGGEQEINIGGWIIKSTAGDKEVAFKFRSSQAIGPAMSVTVGVFFIFVVNVHLVFVF